MSVWNHGSHWKERGGEREQKKEKKRSIKGREKLKPFLSDTKIIKLWNHCENQCGPSLKNLTWNFHAIQ